MIFILNNYEQIVGTLNSDVPAGCPYYADKLKPTLGTAYVSYEFTTPLDHSSGMAELIKEDGYIVRKDQDGNLIQFQIARIEDDHEYGMTRTVYCELVSIELANKRIRPNTWFDVNGRRALENVLAGTRWVVDRVDWAGTTTIEITEYKTALAVIHEIAEKLECELVFRVEFKKNKVSRRVVDLVLKRGKSIGTRFDIDHSIEGITRTIDRRDVVTALIGLGKGDDNGKRITFADIEWKKSDGRPVDKPLGQDWVGDPVALQQWGLDYNGERIHLESTYESEVENAYTLLQETWNELQRRKIGTLTYEMKVKLLSKGIGVGHDQIRIGDTVIISDTDMKPPITLEARILEMEISFADPDESEVVLGNYKPINSNTNRILNKINNQLIQNAGLWSSGEKVVKGPTPPEDPQPNQLWIDTSKPDLDVWKRWDDINSVWKDVTTTTPQQIGAETPDGAQDKADLALEDAKDYTDTRLIDFVAVTTYETDIAQIQSQIDGNITSWFYGVDPLTTNAPASTWTTNDDKNNHLGDLYYNTVSGYAWRWAYENGVYKWITVKDTDVTAALQQAQDAQDTADSKRRVFVVQPIPPYDVGDLWTSGQAVYRATVAKVAGQTYLATDWEKVGDVTSQNTSADTSKVAGETATAIKDKANAGNAAKTKLDIEVGTAVIETIAGAAAKAATAEGNAKAFSEMKVTSGATAPTNPTVGQKWIDTSQTGLDVWKRWTGTGWVEIGRLDLAQMSGVVNTDQVGPGSITETKLADLAVTLNKIGNKAVSGGKVADLTLTAAQVANATLTGTQLATTGTITGSHIAGTTIANSNIVDLTLVESKLANLTLTAGKIANTTLTDGKIADLTLTGGKLAATTITGGKLVNATVTGTQVAATTIASGNIVDLTLVEGKLANLTLTAGKIANATLTGTQIATTGTITGSHVGSTTIAAGNIVNDTITGGKIAATTIAAGEMVLNTLTASQVANATLTGTQFATTGTLTGSHIAGTTIAAGNIVDLTLVEGKLADLTLTAGKIANATLTGTQIATTGTLTGSHVGATTIAASNIVNDTITGGKIAATTIAAGEMVANTLTAGQIANATLTGTQFATTGTLTGSHIAGTTITGSNLVNATVTGTQVAGTTIAGSNLIGKTVTAGQVADTTLTATQIAGTTITGAKLVNNTLTATQLANNTVTATQLANNTITANQLANNTITNAQIANNTITSDLIVATGLDASKLNVDFGGRNLLKNSQKRVMQPNNTGLGTAVLQTDESTPYFRVTAEAGKTISLYDGYVVGNQLTSPFLMNEPYTFSVEVRATTAFTVSLYARDNITPYEQTPTTGVMLTPDTWTKISVTRSFTRANNTTYYSILQANGQIMDYRNWKISKGNKPGDWSPAPEDPIDTATQIVDRTLAASKVIASTLTANEVADSTLTGGKIAGTTITGGNLVNATVTGTQVAATTIAAGNVVNDTITGAKIAATTIAAGEMVLNTLTASQVANNTLTGTQITTTGTLTGSHIATTGTLTGAHVGEATLTGLNLGVASVDAGRIKSRTVSSQELAYNTVTGLEIAATTIAAGEIVNNTITGTQVATTGTLTGSHVAATTIAAGNIAANTITAGQIATSAITSDEIAASTIVGGDIAGSTIAGTNIVGSTITGGLIAGLTIAAGNMVANTITAGQIASATITGANIFSQTITATQIAAVTITAGQIAADTITGAKIAATTIAAGELVANTITSGQIAANTITSGQIAANTITGSQIAANTITSSNIAAKTITANQLNVTELSALTVNLGTITAGTLDGVRVTTKNPLYNYPILSELDNGQIYAYAETGAQTVARNYSETRLSDGILKGTYGSIPANSVTKTILANWVLDNDKLEISKNTTGYPFIKLSATEGLWFDSDDIAVEGKRIYGSGDNLVLESTTNTGSIQFKSPLIVDEVGDWTTFYQSMSNNWVIYGNGYYYPAYKKNPFNEVRLRGAIKSGGNGILYTLPAGFRPLNTLSWPITCGTGFQVGYATVNSAGNVHVNVPAGANTWVTLDVISFEAGV